MRQGSAFRASCLLLVLLPCGVKAEGFPLQPEAVPGSLRLSKTALQISYNFEHKQADWVSYPLGPEQLRNCVQRGNSFRPDPEISPTVSANLSDYSGSGFDRGHLSPAADNKWSASAMNESFLLTNVSPQPPAFNRGLWGRLENLVRAWAMKSKGLLVTTGPVLDRDLSSIGRGRISTPLYFYKVLFAEKTRQAIAFLLPVNRRGGLSAFALPVRALEERTGLNFHHGLDPREEDEMENSLALSAWDFNASYHAPNCRRTLSEPNWRAPALFVSWAN